MPPEHPTDLPGALGLPDAGLLAPGDPVGSHVVTRLIGQGGMGVVYEAEDPLLRRSVAVKVLRPAASGEGGTADRLLAEARSAASLHHPNVVTIHEIDRHGDTYVLVMELVRGGNAQDRLRTNGRFPWVEATRLAADACGGLVAAHAAGVVHRDVKPANLLLGPSDRAKLADFGLARITTVPGGGDGGVRVCGTPAYMSPEQCRGEAVDQRTDVYSLGATYFAMLTGSAPYPSETDVEMMLAQCTGPVPDPRRRVPEIPAGCAAIVARAMAKEPRDRFPGAAAMLAELESLLPPSAPIAPAPQEHPEVRACRRRRVRPAMLVLGLVAVVAAVVVAAAVGLRERGDSPSNAGPPETATTRDRLAEQVIDAGGEVEAVAFTRDDGLMLWVTSGTNTNSIRRLDTRTGQSSNAPLPHRVYCLALSPDGRTAAVGSSDTRIRLFDAADGLTERPGLESPGGSVRAVAVSPDGRWLAAGLAPYLAGGSTLRVWRWGSTDPPVELPGHTTLVAAVAFSPDGKTLVSCGHEGTLILRDTETWTPRRTLSLDGGEGWGLAYSADGAALAAVLYGEGFGVPVWETAGGERITTFRGHTSQVAAVAFSPGGRTAASGGMDGVRLWDRDTGKAIAGPTTDHRGGILRGLAFSHDGTVLVSGASDRKLRIRHVARLTGGDR